MGARLLGLVVTAVLACSLAACGGGDDDEYCAAVKAANADTDTDTDTDTDELSAGAARERIGDIRDAAPDSIQDDWDVLLETFDDPTSIETERLEAAVQAITEFTEDNCDVQAPVG